LAVLSTTFGFTDGLSLPEDGALAKSPARFVVGSAEAIDGAVNTTASVTAGTRKTLKFTLHDLSALRRRRRSLVTN
jgi:hypothetical protein